MNDSDRGGHLVYVLPAVTAGVKDVDPDGVRVDFDLNFVDLRQHRHGSRGGVDPPLGLGFRYPLHPVHSPLVLEAAVGALALHPEYHLVETTQGRCRRVHDVDFPVVQLGITRVGPVEVGGEKAGFVSAGPRPDFDDNVSFIVGILGHQRDPQGLPQLLYFRVDFFQFFPGHCRQLGVVFRPEHGFQVPALLGQLLPSAGYPHELFQAGAFFCQRLNPFEVGGDFRERHCGFDLLVALDDGT